MTRKFVGVSEKKSGEPNSLESIVFEKIHFKLLYQLKLDFEIKLCKF